MNDPELKKAQMANAPIVSSGVANDALVGHVANQQPRNIFWLVIVSGFILLVLLGFLILWFAWSRGSEGHLFQKDFLVNVAAGFVGMGLGTLAAAWIGLALARNKLRQVSKPVLALIQRLRIDGKINEEAARRSVVCAVTLLSESNVSTQIRPGVAGASDRCPICALDINREFQRCPHCSLPKSIWNDRDLVSVNDRALGTRENEEVQQLPRV